MNNPSFNRTAIIVAACLLQFLGLETMRAQSIAAFYQVLGQSDPITTAVPFLLISPDARAGGMGDGGIACSNDANAMHWNVSNLAFIKKKTGIAFSYTPWLRALVPDMNHAYLSFYIKPDSMSAISTSLRYFSMGTIVYTSPTGATLGEFKPNEFAFDAGYSRRLGTRFSIGATGRFIRSDIANGINVAGQDTKTYMGWAVDLGVSFHSYEFNKGQWSGQFITGAALTDLGPKMSYATSVNKEFLPIKSGIAQGVQLLFRQKHRFTSQLEFSKLVIPSPGTPSGFMQELRQVMVSFGAEYDYAGMFKARGGYFFEDESIGRRQYVTVGAGVAYNIFQLDFAYLIPTNAQRSPLEDTMRFTLLFNFDKLDLAPRPHG